MNGITIGEAAAVNGGASEGYVVFKLETQGKNKGTSVRS
jgi:hypothetical protein